MNNRDIRPRVRSRRFQALRKKRIEELRAAGVSKAGAKAFAYQEIIARAKASLTHPIKEVLEAELQFTGPVDDPSPTFRLIYPPRR